jgi:hypothetical protein
VSDFHRVRDVREVLAVNGEAPFGPRQGGVYEMRAELYQEEAGGAGLGTTIGDLGKPPNFLQQL